MTSVFFIVSLILLFLIPRFFSSFPTAIVLLCISGILAFLFDLEQKRIRLIGEVPQGLPHVILPQWNTTAIDYFSGALGIAFVTTVGSFVMAKNVEDRQPHPWNANRDMIALGAAKIVSAFFGSLVPAGSFNRSILNIKAGAKNADFRFSCCFSNFIYAIVFNPYCLLFASVCNRCYHCVFRILSI